MRVEEKWEDSIPFLKQAVMQLARDLLRFLSKQIQRVSLPVEVGILE